MEKRKGKGGTELSLQHSISQYPFSVKYSHNRAAPIWLSLFEKHFEVEIYFVSAKYYY